MTAAALTVTPELTAVPSVSGLVQEAAGSTAGTSLTITMPEAVAAYHAVIIAVCGYYGGAITGITIGGTGGTFTKVATSGGYNCEIWANFNVQPAQASGSIVITASEPGIIAYAYEVNGQLGSGATGGCVFPDKSAGAYSGSGATSWSSGATGTTVSASEFVVGLAFTIPDGGTAIAGPSSGGWVNKAAIENVEFASTDYISAVSGWQVPAAAETFTYSGTVSPSSAWAAVTATFLLMPHQGGWGGYVASNPDGFTSVSAAFTVPSLSGSSGALCSIWVGLGNVKQTGIFLAYDSGGTGNAVCNAWTWFLPSGELWDTSAYPVKAGDELTLSLSYDDSYWYAEITNATGSWAYTEKKSIQAALIGDEAPGGWPFPLTTAEVIIENEGSLPDYGTVTCADITAVPAFDSPYPLATIGTAIAQVPGPFSGGSFTMTWYATGSASTLAITTTSLPGATPSTAYSQTLAATGGTAPYTWSVSAGALPSWAALTTSGVISGTPTSSETGTTDFTVKVTDADGNTATQALAVTVSGSVQPDGPTGTWTLAWNDEFNGASGMSGLTNGLDHGKWNVGWYYGPSAPGGTGYTGTSYTDSSGGGAIEFYGPGALSFPSGGGMELSCYASGEGPDGATYNSGGHTSTSESGGVNTAGLMNITPNTSYSVPSDIASTVIQAANITVEIKCRMPGPTAEASNYWAYIGYYNCGNNNVPDYPGAGSYTEELDIWEELGDGSTGSDYDIHFHAASTYNGSSSVPSSLASTDLSLAYHTYTVQFTYSTITLWVDGIEVTGVSPTTAEIEAQWATPQYLNILFQLVEGYVPTGTDGATPWAIEYVRVFTQS